MRDLSARTRAIQRVLWGVLLLNLAVTAVKLTVGVLTGAMSLVADGFHSLADASANIIGLVGIWVSSRPPDWNHPYGHRKFETVSALAIGGFLLLACWEILRGLAGRLGGSGEPPSVEPIHIIAVALTFPVNLGIVWYESRRARALSSDLLAADVAHTRTDLLITSSVIVSMVAIRLGQSWIDLLVALVVVAVILVTAVGIFRRTTDVLADSVAVSPEEVQSVVEEVPGVWHVHRIRSRGRPDTIWIDLHVKVDPAMSTQQSHAVATEVERRLDAHFPGVLDTVVHVEPGLGPSPSEWEVLATRIRAEADGLAVGIHDLRIHRESEGHYCADLHVEVPADLDLGEAHDLADQLEGRIRSALPAIETITSHIEPQMIALRADSGTEGQARLAKRIEELADELTKPGAAHEIELHDLDGHLAVTMHLTLPSQTPLPEAHQICHHVERRVLEEIESVDRVVVHAEPEHR